MTEETIFTAARQKPTPAERAAYLDEACAGDAELRKRVETLLSSHAVAGFLETPAVQLAAGVVPAVVGADDTRTGPSAPDTELPLDFLAPSEKSGVLGRLGHYEVREVIGRGGMGVVLKAFDENLHRVVAIKVMAPQLAASATARQRFTREARAQAAVSHDHVVTIHAVEEANGLPYIVMQCVAGQSLQDRLDRTGPLPLAEVLRIGMQAASGLAAAQAQGLVHRDVKPANILLENGVERVKLTDFGLARAADDASLTQSGQVAGTPMYMSPEQAEGKPLDARSDLFSLGSVLYVMCIGRPPFRASTSMAVLKRVCEDTPTPVREVNPEVPDWLADVIAKLHAKDPAGRFHSAAEVADLLGRHLAHVQHPSVVPLPAAEKPAAPVPSPAPRRRPQWAVAAAILVLLVAGLGTTEATGVTKLRATVIRIFTPDGTLVVETDDPSVKVTVEGDGDLVITGAGAQEVRLRPGSYRLRATKDGKPVKLDQELVNITRGGTQVVRVSIEPNAAAEPVRPTFVTPWLDSDDWVLKGNEVHQQDERRVPHMILFGGPDWTDYNLEAEVEVLAGNTEVSLVFRAGSPQHFLYAMLGGFGNKAHGLMANRVGGAGDVRIVPGKTEKGHWYRVRVEARGSSFKMFLDGKLLTTGSHDGYPRGCVGLATTGSSARFRDLKVTAPDGKVLLAGVPAVLPKVKDVADRDVGAALQDAVRLKPNDAEARFALGSFQAKWGEWKKAAAEFDRGLELDPTDSLRWQQAAMVHLAAGDLEAYRRVCQEMLQRFGDTADPIIADRIVTACLLLPDAVSTADFDRVQKLAERMVTGIEKAWFYRYLIRTKALADYRAGRSAEAVKWLEKSAPNANGNHDDASMFAILSMSLHRLGRTEDAGTALAKAKAIVNITDPTPGRPHGGDWLVAVLAWYECRMAESLLNKK